MSITDFLNDYSKDSFALDNHPLAKLELKDRKNYLMALSLIIFADGEVSENEKKLFNLLAKSLKLDDDSIDNCINFGRKPESKKMDSIKKTLQNKDTWFTFIVDSNAIACVFELGRSSNIIDERHPEEKEAIELFKNIAGIPKEFCLNIPNLGPAISSYCDSDVVLRMLEEYFAEQVELTEKEKEQLQISYCKTDTAKEAINKVFCAFGEDLDDYSEEDRVEAFMLFGNNFNEFIKWLEARNIKVSYDIKHRLTCIKVELEYNPPYFHDVFAPAYQEVRKERAQNCIGAYNYMVQIAKYVDKNIYKEEE